MLTGDGKMDLSTNVFGARNADLGPLDAAVGKPTIDGVNVFADVDDSAWYATPIIWAQENQVTGGIGEGKFGPLKTCTRAEVVTFLYKVYANK